MPADRRRGRPLRRRPVILAALLLAAGGCALALGSRLQLSRSHVADGILGVVLGLYIGSHPAANFVDLLVYWRVEGPPYASRRAVGWWLVLNGLLLASAGTVIALGATRFVGRPL